MARRTPETFWDAFQREVVEDEAARVSRLTPAELRRELVEEGVDLEALAEQARALRKRLEEEPVAAWQPARLAEVHAGRWRRTAVRVVALLAAVLACVALAILLAPRRLRPIGEIAAPSLLDTVTSPKPGRRP